ncbi:YadA-like family protein [Conservatibacter flavescens]|uniref:Adhesin n=1 Tax=Conservatibacter flavescens TaxID=28161 RepID=A0A2M8S153_9PAST|nr:YadA-like family protein [Conservatibacter flavescens]PJG84834.1 hypothetical protein CVP05_09875 [Conservatibacter flavescens]
MILRRKFLNIAISAALSTISHTTLAASNTFGEAIGTDSVAIGQSSVSTAINGIANGKSAIATGDNFTPEAFKQLQAQELAKLAEKEKLTNQLTELNAQLAKAQEDKKRFQDELAAIDRQISKNATDAQKRQELQAQKDKLIADTGVNGSAVNEFVNYYTVLSSLDWTKFAPTDTGLSAMREQLKAKTESFAPTIASQISDDKYNEYIHGYVNAETRLVSNVSAFNDKIRSPLDTASRKANIVSVKDYYLDKSTLNDYTNNYYLTRLGIESFVDNVLTNDYLSFFDKGIRELSDMTINEISYVKNNIKNKDYSKYFNAIDTTIKSGSGKFQEYIIQTRGVNSWYGNSLFDVRLPLLDGTQVSVQKMVFDLNTVENPLTNERSQDYSSYKKLAEKYINLYENIDTNYSQDNLVVNSALKAKESLTPYYNEWKKIYDLVSLYEEIQTATGSDLQTKQASFLELLNEYRGAEHTQYLNDLTTYTRDSTNAYLNSASGLGLGDNFKNFLTTSRESFLNYLKEMESGFIGYNRTDEYISQIEKIAGKIAEIDSQMPPVPSDNPTRTEAENGLNEADKAISGTEDKIRNVIELIEAIKPSLTERGENSIAVGAESFASGHAAIAIGHNTVVTGDSSTAIGRDNLVTGHNTHVFGDNNAVTANGSVVSGSNNLVSANQSLVYGNNTIVTENATNTVVLGNNITADVANSVALGNQTTLSEPVGTPSMTIQNKVHEFAGKTPVGTVSVGAEGAERTITNVAAGRVSASSTDAINGSQLYAVAQVLNDLSVIDLDDISKSVNQVIEAGNSIRINNTGDKVVVNGATIQGGINTTVDYDTASNTYTVNANIDVEQPNVVAGNNTSVEFDATSNTYTVSANVDMPKVTAGSNAKVDYNQGTNTYTVSADLGSIDLSNLKVNPNVEAGNYVRTMLDTINNVVKVSGAEVKAGNNTQVTYDNQTNSFTVSSAGIKQGEKGNVNVTYNSEDNTYLVDAADVKAGNYTTTSFDKEANAYIVNGAEVKGGKNAKVTYNAANNTFTVDASTIKAGERVEVGYDEGTNTYTVSAKKTTMAGKDGILVTEPTDGSTDYVVGLDEPTTAKINQGQTAYETMITKGFTFNGDKGSTGNKLLGSTIQVNGDRNITTTANSEGIRITLNRDIDIDSADIGGVKINERGIQHLPSGLTGQRYENPADNHGANIGDVKAIANNVVNQHIGAVNNKIDKVDKKYGRAVASNAAMSNLPQVIASGRSMIAAAVGGYRNNQALAVGYSRASDNGKLVLKTSVSTNVSGKKDITYGASVGYSW